MIKKVSIISVIFTLAFAARSYAKSIEVSLAAPDYIIQQHSGNVQLGIRYADGNLSAWNLFSREELKNGIKTKTINVRDDSNITVCDFQWSIMENPPIPVEGKTSSLLHDSSFNGVVHDSCQIDLSSGTLQLTTGFSFEELTLTVNGSALFNHDSALLIGSMKIAGIDKPFSFDHSKASQSAEWIIHVLNPQETFKGNLSLTWFTNSGATKEETIPVTDSVIEIN